MRAGVAIVGVLVACAAAQHALHPSSGDKLDLIGRGPTAPSPAPLACTGTTDERFACFEAFWRGRLDARGVTGGVAVITPDGSVHLSTHGARGTTVTPESRFAIASSSKIVLAMTVMSLVEAHELSLDMPIGTYLPEFAAAATGIGDVTLAQLLSHTSGSRRRSSMPASPERTPTTSGPTPARFVVDRCNRRRVRSIATPTSATS